MKPSNTIVVSPKYIEEKENKIADLSKKVHILNEANEKNYNALCNEIKKNNKLQEQLKEANAIIEDMRPFVQGSMKRQTFTRILHYEDKWCVK